MFQNLINLLERHQKIKTLDETQKEKYSSKIQEIYEQINTEKTKLHIEEEFVSDYICMVCMPFKTFNICSDILQILKLSDWDCYEISCYRKSQIIEFKCTKISDVVD